MIHKQVAKINVAITMHEEMCQNLETSIETYFRLVMRFSL